MRGTALALGGLLVALMGIALWQGQETFALGWRTSLQQLLRFLPILVIAMLVAGFTDVLLPQAVVERWLTDSSGWRGIGIAWLAGVLTPGGSLIGLPLVATMFKAGVGISVLMTYITAVATLSLVRVPLEVGFYGWRLTALRVAVSLVLPVIAGLLTQLVWPLIQNHA